MKLIKELSIIVSMVVLLTVLVGFKTNNPNSWVAPTSADAIVNPLKNDANAIAAGKELYKNLCSVCHGPKGKGDGMAGAGLTPRPTNLTTAEFHSQSDGAIFWKIENGRAPMASYKDIIPEKNRWEIINYIKTLKK